MTDFTLLTPDTVPGYLASSPALQQVVDPDALDSVAEIGDGNMNLVFVVRDRNGRGVVLKQSLPHARSDPGWPITRDRSRREAVLLSEHFRFDAEHVPAVYSYDADNHVLAIEDLSDHQVWRRELIAGRVHDYAAEALGRYVARVGFGTSVFGMPVVEKRQLVAATVNAELTEITEDLVFTEPYIEHEHNSVLPANEPDVLALRSDRALIREIGKAKIAFIDNTQALLHGDLHTGSVFVRAEGQSVRAFDPEFGAYGPIGFDLGAVWANLVLAAARAEALGEPRRADQILRLPVVLLDAFEEEYRRLWPSRVDPRVYPDEVLEDVLAGIRLDSAVYAAAKAIRRIVGFAKVADIETLEPEAREGAARGVLRAGRALAVERHDDPSPVALNLRVAEILAETARR
ncbi:S-methyl-5-thioribose kinase [Naasia sp. SYSU D00948]|uniref:S-methyl-5-thioribose kinase n=1 Tax=Naasia sp. SYSU D00948 TaxID=2817379 RepID=UPI001B3169AA|nr:S-methyl-5-thioribose kinase [Naasia sp. SYSU D00948]